MTNIELRYDALNEGESQVQSISGLTLDPSNDGKLLHFTAQLYNAKPPLVDPTFNIQTTGLKLYRDASMYQWKQHSTTKTTTLSDGTKRKDTTYSWKKGWYDSWINSKIFKDCKCPTETIAIRLPWSSRGTVGWLAVSRLVHLIYLTG